MDKYLLDDYNRKRGASSSVRERKMKKALELYLNGLDKKEIAEILEVTPKTITDYFRWLRNNGYITREKEEEIEVQRALELERIKAKKSKAEERKLTHSKVGKIVNNRDREIMELYHGGFTIQEVAKRMHMTLNQAKERYLALGLSIYTEEDIRRMAEEENRRKERLGKAEKPKDEQEEARQEVREESKEEKPQEVEKMKPQYFSSDVFEILVNSIPNYNALCTKIRTFIKFNENKRAIELARYFIEVGDFLTEKQKNKLIDFVNFYDILAARERKQQGIKNKRNKKEPDERQ